jgi:hypothetical protein
MKALLYATLVLGLVAGSVQAGTILVVSDCNDPLTADGDHNDDSLVTFLQGLGHTVDTYGMNKTMQNDLDATDLQHANDADLIVVSRRTSSGSYNRPTQWNGIATPLIQQSHGYLGRNSRWGWFNAGNADQDKTVMTMVIDAGQTGHAFVTGVTTSPTVTMFDTSGAPTPGELPKAVNTPDGGVRTGTVEIASYNGKPMLGEFASGFDFDEGGALKFGTAAGRRAYLGHWSYDDGTTDTNGPGGTVAEWEDYITADYKTVLTNMVSNMIPEPATLTLLAVGVAATLIRRKK